MPPEAVAGMSERSPYSRVYWTIRNDPRLAAIYPVDSLLAAWIRLLIAADMAWPAAADVPASVKKSSLTALCDAGIVELLPSRLFRFHGLDSERGRRREAAQASVAHRTGIGRVSDGYRTIPERSTSRAEPSRAENSRAEPRAGAREDDAALAYFDVMGHAPSGRALGWLNDLATSSGEPALCMALRSTPCDPPRTYLSRVQLALTTVTAAPPKPAGPTTEAEFMAAQVHIPDPLTAEIMASYGTKPA